MMGGDGMNGTMKPDDMMDPMRIGMQLLRGITRSDGA